MSQLKAIVCLTIGAGLAWTVWSMVAAARPPAPRELSVIVFPGGFNWPLWVATDRGFAARRGLKISVTETRNSVEQMVGLSQGRFDIAMTGFDNVVAYREGQGGGKEPAAPIAAVMGGDTGFLSLIAQPGISDVGQLKGRKIAVDAPATGYAFALYDILARAGVGRGDYELIEAGGVVQRYEKLLAGEFAATLLVSPLDGQAEKKGFGKLANVIDVFGHYQGYVAAVRTDWAERHARPLTGYVAAYRDALDWLYDPANKAAAMQIFIDHIPGATQLQAEAAYNTLLDPHSGFTRDAAIQRAGMRTVLSLRQRYASGPKVALGPPERYYLSIYYEAASRLRRKLGSVGATH